ncbi:MAG: polyphenol oxidase family protein [Solirubrobacterales bacterium]|nr:polyphenol oxidase family protein [Solirubrobacterales bacterium]
MSRPQPLEVALPGGGRALFTTRAQGNLSTAAGEGCEEGRAARERLCAELGLRRLCAGPQVHGALVRRVRAIDRPGAQPLREPADGCATSLPLVGAMVLAADCLPVALGSPGAVAMVHAGWRGLAAGVLEEGVAAIRELASEGEGWHARAGSGAALAEIGAVIGPCAGACCYEAGEEVHVALGRPGEGRAKLDLRAIARARLLAAGVREVREVGGCTICDAGLFSHRREGARAGRQAGVAWLS